MRPLVFIVSGLCCIALAGTLTVSSYVSDDGAGTMGYSLLSDTPLPPVNPDGFKPSSGALPARTTIPERNLVYVPPNEIYAIQYGMPVDVYALTDPAAGIAGFQLVARNITVSVEPQDIDTSEIPGLAKVSVRIFARGGQAEGIIASLAEGYPLGVSMRQETRYSRQYADVWGRSRVTDQDGTSGFTPSVGKLAGPVIAPGEGDVDPVLLEQLRSVNLAFSHPDTMTRGRRVEVELVLSPDIASKLADEPEPGNPETPADVLGLSPYPGNSGTDGDVRYSTRIVAQLSGRGFEIFPAGPQSRTYLPDEVSRWVWTVTPRTGGQDQVMTLDVNALIMKDGVDLPPVPIQSLTESIQVETSLWGHVTALSAGIEVAHAALATLGGTLVAFGGWSWFRGRHYADTPGDRTG